MSAPTAASLYIGDIPANASVTELENAFKKVLHEDYACIKNVLIAPNTNREGGCKHGYLSVDVDKAQDILDACQDVRVGTQTIRLNKVEKRLENRREVSGNICIRRIPREASREDIHKLFVNGKKVRSFKMKDPIADAKFTIAYVHYEDAGMAKDMIEQYNDYELSGVKLLVGPFVHRRDRLAQSAESLRLYAKDFPKELSEEEVVKKIVGDAAYSSKFFGESRGAPWMLVNFDDKVAFDQVFSRFENAESRPEECAGWVVVRAVKAEVRRKKLAEQHRQLQITRSQQQEGRNLYVNRLPEDFTQAKFEEMMGKHGEIESAVCRMDKGNNTCMGFGYCLYKTKEAATGAKDLLHNAPCPYGGDNDKRIIVVPYLLPHQRRANPVGPGPRVPGQHAGNGAPRDNMGGRSGHYQQQAYGGQPVHHGHQQPMYAHHNMQAPGVMSMPASMPPQVAAPAPALPKAQVVATAAVTLEEIQKKDKRVIQMVGNALFSRVTKNSEYFGVDRERVGKIIGMIVQLEPKDLFDVYESDVALLEKCKEAIDLLNKKQTSKA